MVDHFYTLFQGKMRSLYDQHRLPVANGCVRVLRVSCPALETIGEEVF